MKRFILALIATSALYASPAFKGPLNLQQADGSHFRGELKGDEWFNWVEDSKGNAIKFNHQTKNYEFAKIKNVKGALDLVPSGQKVPTGIGSQAQDVSIIDKKTLSRIWQEKREKALARMHPSCPTKQKQ